MAEQRRITVYALTCDGVALGNYHDPEKAENYRQQIIEHPELFLKVEPWTVSGIEDECIKYADDDELI